MWALAGMGSEIRERDGCVEEGRQRSGVTWDGAIENPEIVMSARTELRTMKVGYFFPRGEVSSHT